jgi:hypothetical protein
MILGEGDDASSVNGRASYVRCELQVSLIDHGKTETVVV